MWTSRQHSWTLAASFLTISVFLINFSFKLTPRAAGGDSQGRGRFVRTVSRQHYREVTIPVRTTLTTCPHTAKQDVRSKATVKKIVEAQRGAVVGLVRGFNDFGSYGKLQFRGNKMSTRRAV